MFNLFTPTVYAAKLCNTPHSGDGALSGPKTVVILCTNDGIPAITVAHPIYCRGWLGWYQDLNNLSDFLDDITTYILMFNSYSVIGYIPISDNLDLRKVIEEAEVLCRFYSTRKPVLLGNSPKGIRIEDITTELSRWEYESPEGTIYDLYVQDYNEVVDEIPRKVKE